MTVFGHKGRKNAGNGWGFRRFAGAPDYRELYKRGKESIERVFADTKEKHAMRYTQYRGLAQITNWVKLKLAAMNL